MNFGTEKEKKALIKKHTPRTRVGRNCLFAFIVGGTICLVGELLLRLYLYLGISEDSSATLTSSTLIFIASALTGLGLFDRIARFAGAGTLVPITGFSNAVASQAIDAKSEGYVLGVGAKIFTVAGPVILYGTVSGVIYGIIYYLISLANG